MQYKGNTVRATVLAVTTAAVVFAGNASAAGGITFDTSDAVAGLAAIGAAMSAVGIAKIAPAAIAVGWKWVKAAIFG